MSTIAYVRATNVYDDSRATKEIKTLVEGGHMVYVLGWNRNDEPIDTCKRVFRECGKKVRFAFYECPLPNGIGLKNISKLIGFNKWIMKMLNAIRSLDSVHICNLDTAIGAVKFCKNHKIPYVYDIYDYYIDSHDIPAALCGMIERMEIAVINNARVTIICTEERREQIAKANPRKVCVIHNSPDVGEVEIKEQIYDYVYCGSFGDMRLLKEILEDYPWHEEYRIVTAGYGQYCEIAKGLNEKYDNFTFLGSVEYSKVLELETESKVISAIYQPTIRNHRLCAPNKFYEALSLAKPVIVCRGTGIDRIVEENNIGIVIDYSSKQFYDALSKLCCDDALCSEMGKRARRIYEEKFSWDIMKARLLNLYE